MTLRLAKRLLGLGLGALSYEPPLLCFVSGGAGVQQQTGGEVAAGEESIEAATAKLRLSDGDSDGEQWQVRCVASRIRSTPLKVPGSIFNFV